MLITANQPLGEWGKIFPDQAMTSAAIDRLVLSKTSAPGCAWLRAAKKILLASAQSRSVMSSC
jgi:DNA replication protein DnaC